MNIDTLKAALRDGMVEVRFKKLDGTIRMMNCTLNQDLIPADKIPVEKKPLHPEIAALFPPKEEKASRVYEPSLGEWRSFRYDSVIQWTVYCGNV